MWEDEEGSEEEVITFSKCQVCGYGFVGTGVKCERCKASRVDEVWRRAGVYRPDAAARINLLEKQLATLTRARDEAREQLAAITRDNDMLRGAPCRLCGAESRDDPRGQVCSGGFHGPRAWELQDQLAATNATIEKCKAAGFIDDKGEVRKVLGTLPTTADNHIVGANCTIWHPKHGACVCRSDVDSGCWATAIDPHSPARGELFLVEECYSTAEAACEKGGA
jgi:hypothetical protein